MYDPSTNPRFLPPEEADPHITRDLDQEIARTDEYLRMFELDAWAYLIMDIESQINLAKSKILNGSVTTMEEVNYLRGQISACEQLLQLPSRYAKTREALHAQRATLLEAAP